MATRVFMLATEAAVTMPATIADQRRQHVLQDDDRTRRNAGDARGQQIVADGAQIAARLRVAQEEIAAEADAGEEEDRDRNAEQRALAEPQERGAPLSGM